MPLPPPQRTGQKGRPRKVDFSNPNVVLDVCRLARMKASNVEIASSLGISVDALEAGRKRFAVFAEQMDHARSLAVLDAKQVIFDELRGKERLRAATAVIRFWGDGRERVEISTPPGRPLETKDTTPRKPVDADDLAKALVRMRELTKDA